MVQLGDVSPQPSFVCASLWPHWPAARHRINLRGSQLAHHGGLARACHLNYTVPRPFVPPLYRAPLHSHPHVDHHAMVPSGAALFCSTTWQSPCRSHRSVTSLLSQCRGTLGLLSRAALDTASKHNATASRALQGCACSTDGHLRSHAFPIAPPLPFFVVRTRTNPAPTCVTRCWVAAVNSPPTHPSIHPSFLVARLVRCCLAQLAVILHGVRSHSSSSTVACHLIDRAPHALRRASRPCLHRPLRLVVRMRACLVCVPHKV